MIGITKLHCGAVTPGDALRYGRETAQLPANLLQFAKDKRPVTVWNTTRRCNLNCNHCYADSRDLDYVGELSTEEGHRLVEDLAEFRVPVLLFSGGEPLMRPDLFELISHAKEKGIRPVISTNGTLITAVDNHSDGVYLYLKMLEEQPERAGEVLELLKWNGGNSSGIGIANIDSLGFVHADQFWWSHSFGNVRDRKFGEIWTDLSDPLMRGLKDRRALLKGRCGACKWVDICNGNFRVRAQAVHGDPWQEDPACYLTDEEIGLAPAGMPAAGR